ncbi:MAG: hypothetical protein H6713_27370 [Myxococcales bacterium]|nr:hypothetical protein [Myxococcales bacterium]
MPRPRLTVTLPAAAALLAALTSSAAARADSLSGTRGTIEERAHAIELRVDRGAATLRVRRTLYNRGVRHDQAVLWIDLPGASVATGLRTRGRQGGRTTWFSGQLLEAELAAARYRQLTGIGGYSPRDPALLSWRAQDRLVLQVFPVAPERAKQVEYTLTAPTRYEEGRHRITLERLGTDALPASYTLAPARRGDRLYLDGAPIRPGRRVVVTGEPIEVALAPRAPRWLEGRLAVTPTAAGRVLTHLDLETSPAMTRVPDDARVVVIVDASRSRDEDDIAASLAATDAYLSHFEGPGVRGAEVALLSFDRRVTSHTGGFVPVGRARALARALELPPANGSALDEALDAAEALLRPTPTPAGVETLPPEVAPTSASARGSRRVLVLSDLNFRSSLTRERLQALARRTGAIVHLAELDAGEPWVHAHASPLDAVARATGGRAWTGYADPERRVADDEHRRALERWARPLSLDEVAVEVAGLEPDIPTSLEEGAHAGWFELAAGPLPHVRVSGELWAEPVEEVFLPDDAEAARWSALVFGSPVLEALKPEELLGLATRGGAVSPVTSYLAIEPGVRPSTEGLEWNDEGTIGLGGVGLIGKGGGGGSGRGSASHDLRGFLTRALAAAWRTCGGEGHGLRVVVETTSREVVDVPEVWFEQAQPATRELCLREAAWALRLPQHFERVHWRRWTIRP